MAKTIYYMIGIPGSGKTYFAKQLASRLGAVHLSSDHMRKSMFRNPDRFPHQESNPWLYGGLDYVTSEIMDSGHSVVRDSNHNFKHIRQHIRDLAKTHGAEAVLIEVRVPIEKAIERATDRPEDSYTRKLSKEIVLHYQETQEYPDSFEEQHIIIDGLLPFEDQFKQFQQQL